MSKFESLRVEIEAEQIIALVDWCAKTGTALAHLTGGRMARVQVWTNGVSAMAGDAFIFEDENPMGGYVCPAKVFVRKYRVLEVMP